MSEKKKELQEIIIFGEESKQELEKRMNAIITGKEALPDGRKYPDCKDDVFVIMIWDNILEDPFKPGYFKGSKQILDIMVRPVEEDDLQLPLLPGTERSEIEVAIRGGIDSINLTFDEKRILHAIEAALDDEAIKKGFYPDEIHLTRASLYDYLGIESKQRPDGSLYRAEALGYQRKHIEKTLLKLSDKPFPFVFKMRTGTDKNGEAIWRVALTNAPILKAAKIYEDVKQRELPGVLRQTKRGERRFSHYKIRLNKNAIGEIERYFRYIPRLLGKSISDYRKDQGGRASVTEINFIEYLFTESREIIEINFLKLAKKLKIKTSGKPERARKALSRCYETALALGYILKAEEDQPGLRDTKDVIYLNPERFKYLKKRSVD